MIKEMVPPNKPIDLDHTDLYINREISWLEFNARVLQEALLPSTPLLEKLKFLSIFTTNLDEFFMVRIAGLKKILLEDISLSDTPDSMTAQEVMDKIRKRTIELLEQQYTCLHTQVIPELAKNNIYIRKMRELKENEVALLNVFFHEHVFPVLTPLAVDPAHPFPFLSNLSIYLAVTLEDAEGRVGQGKKDSPLLGLVEVPTIIPRLVPVPSLEEGKHGQLEYVLLEDLIAENLASLFLGFTISGSFAVRVTRNLDYNLLENEVVDLLTSVQKEVINREHNEAVRLEIVESFPPNIVKRILPVLGLKEENVYRVPGPLFISGLRSLCELPMKELKDPAFNPRLPKQMAGSEDIFSLIAKQDLLVHHPYESFYAVIEFINLAAFDPNVLAIKQTLYRSSGDSPIIDALIAAAENGKQVTAVVELKARFDEKNNIVWARRLENAGVNVVFGFIGLKTHAKATLVIRKEKNSLARYLHLATGNYNSTSAKLYTDIGVFTADKTLAGDIAALFNLLTGFNVLTGETKLRKKSAYPKFKKAILSPLSMRSTLVQIIDREIDEKTKGGRGFILAKMNGLDDKELIKKLYQASMAGVEVKLIVRGICCLRPGVPGISDNIEVISIVDRFLEHSRIFYFFAGGKEEVYLSSADWMNRNMDRRIEIMFPVEQTDIKRHLIDNILAISWADNVKARQLRSDGTYELRPPPAANPIRSQQRFIEWAREGGIQSIPYELAIRHNSLRKKGVRPVAKKSLHIRKT